MSVFQFFVLMKCLVARDWETAGPQHCDLSGGGDVYESERVEKVQPGPYIVQAFTNLDSLRSVLC